MNSRDKLPWIPPCALYRQPLNGCKSMSLLVKMRDQARESVDMAPALWVVVQMVRSVYVIESSEPSSQPAAWLHSQPAPVAPQAQALLRIMPSVFVHRALIVNGTLATLLGCGCCGGASYPWSSPSSPSCRVPQRLRRCSPARPRPPALCVVSSPPSSASLKARDAQSPFSSDASRRQTSIPSHGQLSFVL